MRDDADAIPFHPDASGTSQVLPVVFDTVGFLRALLRPDGPWGAIVFDLGDHYQLTVSDKLIDECSKVFSRPALNRRLSRTPGRDLQSVESILRRGVSVTLGEIPAISRDASDDYLIAMAKAGKAKLVVTEDKDLLSIGDLDGILFVTGRTFLELLQTRRKVQ